MSLKRVNFSPLHTFSRATVKNVFQPEPDGFGGTNYILKQVASGAPAFEWDPVTGESLGLSIEESRTNLFAYSKGDVFGSTPSFTEDGIKSPRGLMEATLINDVQALSRRYELVITAGTYSSGQTITARWFQKRINFTGAGSSLNNDSLLAPSAPVNASYVGGSLIKLADLADGWEYFETKWTITNGSLASTLRLYFGGDSFVDSPVGITDPFAFFGIQFEAAATGSSFIFTDGATATRLADVVTVPDLSGWFNASEGTFVVEYDFKQIGTQSRTLLTLGQAVGSRIEVFHQAGATPTILAGGGTSTNIGTAVEGKNKIALKYTADGLKGSYNGGAVVSTGIGTTNYADFTTFRVGANVVVSNFWNGTIANIKYERRAVSDAELQALSTL